MYRLGHYGASLLAYTPLGTAVAITGYETAAIIGGIVCVALSTLPDCDTQIPFIEHRGPTHTLVFALLVGTALAAIAAVLVDAPSPSADIGFVVFAFIVGMLSILSHLLADVVTPMGIRPFWPISQRHYTANVTPAKNPTANYGLFTAGISAVLAAVAIVVVVG